MICVDGRIRIPDIVCMTDERMSGIALIAGSIASIITMALHPTGHQVLTPGSSKAILQLAVAVHALALLSLPVLFAGAAGLSKYLARAGRLAFAALTFYGFATVAVMNAAVFSGFVATGVAHRILEGGSLASDPWQTLFRYTGDLNQGFALVFVVASSVAILLWSIALLRGGFAQRASALYGCFIASVTMLAVLSGHIRLNVHGFGAIILAQSVWFVWMGIHLLRTGQAASSYSTVKATSA